MSSSTFTALSLKGQPVRKHSDSAVFERVARAREGETIILTLRTSHRLVTGGPFGRVLYRSVIVVGSVLGAHRETSHLGSNPDHAEPRLPEAVRRRRL